MNHLLLIILVIAVLLQLLKRESGALIITLTLVVLAVVGRLMGSSLLAVLLLLGAVGVAVCGLPAIRQQWLSPKLLALFKSVAPKVSETERVALEAGTVGWDGELFSGQPDWNRLLSNPDKGLSKEERAFLKKQCSVAAGMCDGWEISVERADLPGDLWKYLKKEKFFGMIIPQQYGGLGFSAKAQSAVLQKLAFNDTLMVVVGVPNSLGPGELLLKYGTEEQKNYYLPRLADGREIPCFGLTAPRAGSDATSIPDVGVVCRQEVDGEEVLGIRLSFEKRWITLAPIATVVGLAFRMFDPEGLLGDTDDIGITCALIPRDTEGLEIGRRHYPIGAPFMNGPLRAKDLFIPLDWIIGGPRMAGQGWRMLVECLSVGRCITLPSGASGCGRYVTGYAGGFTRIRRQFNMPVAEMEGVQAPLARIAAQAYIARATVRHTANMIDAGEKPAVPSAILKSQLTEFQRQMLIDAMDVHGGKAVTLGPRNYLGLSYAATATSITVEGANIMTRSLMIFGQGAVRCHPWVLPELEAANSDNLSAFDKAIFSHIGMVAGNAARAFSAGLGLPMEQTPLPGEAQVYGWAVNRYSAAFALLADAAMASLGASLKQREMLSARLADMLSNLYMTTMVLKHWHETRGVQAEEALFRYSCEWLLYRTEQAMVELLENLPGRGLARGLKMLVMPFGRSRKLPSDDLTRTIAEAVSTDSALRRFLLEDTWQEQAKGQKNNPLARYNHLLEENPRATELYRRVDKAYAKGELPNQALHPEERFACALDKGILSQEEYDFMQGYEAEVLEMLTVDDFALNELARNKSKVIWHNGKPKTMPKPIH
ncbi:acyl-CoA dehydrogenase [Aestuariirhabdus litorea]|uniref:Acyl-coenzyme A dehydrogenase n=1 Tax=Aestuariirhabdus litorea TaxID=2528527 RepID=A0A3P3VQ94_9GAMM|nr:acyl-CoA dehydrogenase [Aestuariirhabdus litorea]RRJ83826.1 acyl-CoA dehydrogenase [Aestuariirhabdus litorea]RWW97049.1 acyl-CoA dehydrogenase [Endozoicomonadaceae bacterium GTF-13]